MAHDAKPAPLPAAAYPDNRQAAEALFAYLGETGRVSPQFSLRPYNRFTPEFTDWWVIPSRAWPAYRHGKLFVSPAEPPPDPPECMYCGYYVEKGFSPEAARALGLGRQSTMQPDWYWHDFTDLCRTGKIDGTLRRAIEVSGADLRVRLDAYEYAGDSGGGGVRKPPHDRLRFTVALPDLTFALAHPAREVLKPLNACGNLRELAARLPQVDQVGFFWVDLLVGICLHYGGSPPDALGAEELWRRAFEPWWAWVK